MIPFISGPTVIGIDIAGGGDDTALVQRVGNRLKRIATCKYESTTDTTSWIVDQLFNAGYKRGCGWQILIDATAIGRGPYDQLRKQEIPVLPFNFGGKRGKTSSRDTSRHFDHSNANLAFMSRSNRP